LCHKVFEDPKLAARVVKNAGLACPECGALTTAVDALFFDPPWWEKVKRFFAA
jgi:hypothetical protein